MGRATRKRRLKKQKTLNNIPVDNESLYENLRSWMLCNNWQATCNLIPHVFKTTGRGLMTLDKVEANQIVLQVPKLLLITTNTVSKSPIQYLFSINKTYSAQCVLAIFLIYEKHLENASYWKPYLDTLPDSYSNPEFCTKNEKKVLPSYITNELGPISKKLKTSYQYFIEYIKILPRTNCNHCKQSLYNIFTYHKYTWAYYTVNTRAIYINDKNQNSLSINIKGDDNLALAPLLDLFNHTCETVADAQLAKFSNGKEFYQIRALKSYDTNMQVFINYGAHSNLKLYLEYGFFIPQNPLDQISFKLSDIEKCHQVSKHACNFIKTNGIDLTMAFTVEGLNYSAKNALFAATSNKFEKSFWKEKIYREEFNSKDLQLLNNLGIAILQNIRIETMISLKNMMTIVHRSESFSIAISFMKEYIKLIEKSLNQMESFSYN